MAIPEACGLWIEQRVQEEIDRTKDTGASLREIGRVVAAEVERYFETKVNPRAVEKRAERMTATNVAPEENPTKPATNHELEKLEKKHGGARKGAGRKPKDVMEKKDPVEATGSEVTDAMQFSFIAISQLKRIRSDDPKRGEAFDRVALWITKNK